MKIFCEKKAVTYNDDRQKDLSLSQSVVNDEMQ